MLIIKTTTEQYPALEQTILSNHSYDVPEIIATPIIDGHNAYLQWIHDSIQG